MTFEIDDVRIQNIRPLMAPSVLIEDLLRSEAQSETVAGGRSDIERVLTGADDRLGFHLDSPTIIEEPAHYEHRRGRPDVSKDASVRSPRCLPVGRVN